MDRRQDRNGPDGWKEHADLARERAARASAWLDLVEAQVSWLAAAGPPPRDAGDPDRRS